MKPGRVLALAVLALAATGAGARAQTAAMARFEALLGGKAVRLVGPRGVRWLPGGLGYLEQPTDTATNRPFRIDPITGARSALIPPAAEARLLAEYGRLTGARVSRLPFTRFELIRGGSALTFDEPAARFVFAIDSGMLHRLPYPAKTGPLDLATARPGEFSPDHRRYAFIRDYDNLWLFEPETGREERLVTGTSTDNLIGFLGVGPWYVWSPDGNRIAYVKADSRALYQYPLVRDLDQKATVEYLRYPFTNDPNPLLELHIIDVATKRDVLVAKGTVEQPFIRDLEWFPDGKELTYQIVDQWESTLELRAADPATGQSRVLLTDSDPAFLDPLHNFRVLADGNRFLWSSERSGWRHIYLYDRRGGEPKPLTSGDFVTKDVLGVDEKRGVIYFVGATRLGLEQHLFKVGLDGKGMAPITTEPGWHDPSLDPSLRSFVDRYSTTTRAWTVTLRAIDGKPIRELAHPDTTGLHALGIIPPELMVLKSADGVTDLNAILYKPADFSASKRYPVVVSIYGGPHTRAVRDQFSSHEFNMALAQLGFLVVEVDARGTLDREKKFQTGVYLKMGQVDIDDQAAAIRQLRSRPYVDSTRVGITGISHGGYLTLMAVLRYPDVFQVGVSGAPIVDLKNGPRQYIGRIMRTPQANPEGYAKGNPLALAPTLRSRLLIVYGSDDHNALNVNSMQLMRTLIDAGRPFDVAVYPHGAHVLEGADAIHGLKTTVSYFLEHLKPEGWETNRDALWR